MRKPDIKSTTDGRTQVTVYNYPMFVLGAVRIVPSATYTIDKLGHRTMSFNEHYRIEQEMHYLITKQRGVK